MRQSRCGGVCKLRSLAGPDFVALSSDHCKQRGRLSIQQEFLLGLAVLHVLPSTVKMRTESESNRFDRERTESKKNTRFQKEEVRKVSY